MATKGISVIFAVVVLLGECGWPVGEGFITVSPVQSWSFFRDVDWNHLPDPNEAPVPS